MPNPLENQPPTFDQQVAHFKDAIQNHQNVTCEFNALPRDEQIKMARALSAGKLPDVEIKWSAGNGGMTITFDQKNADGVCKVPARPEAPNPNAYDAEELATARQWQALLKEQAPQLKAAAAAEYQKAHDPARLARGIEDAAVLDLKDDQNAKLEVRQRIEALQHESAQVRQQVLERLQADGSKWNPANPVPRAEIQYAKDANGNENKNEPIDIVFSSAYAYHGSDKVSLTKTVAEQARDAGETYNREVVGKMTAGTAGSVGVRETLKTSGALPESSKLWWEKVQTSQ
ncbi:MAG: hypothetical protein JSS86_03380 [Cyanobacteria bacterium SZAS LIN-2]|nr:hypothetical protein [Cyanobacteria bacterium SZAS LIN-3]MBS1995321.1 hypothetical protein [Cyanobacteria bacterium SZAS LIN-2]